MLKRTKLKGGAASIGVGIVVVLMILGFTAQQNQQLQKQVQKNNHQIQTLKATQANPTPVPTSPASDNANTDLQAVLPPLNQALQTNTENLYNADNKDKLAQASAQCKNDLGDNSFTQKLIENAQPGTSQDKQGDNNFPHGKVDKVQVTNGYYNEGQDELTGVVLVTYKTPEQPKSNGPMNNFKDPYADRTQTASYYFNYYPNNPDKNQNLQLMHYYAGLQKNSAGFTSRDHN